MNKNIIDLNKTKDDEKTWVWNNLSIKTWLWNTKNPKDLKLWQLAIDYWSLPQDSPKTNNEEKSIWRVNNMFVHILVDCLALKYFVFESAWWGLLRNDVMWTKVDIYVFISTIIIACTCTLLKYQVTRSVWPNYLFGVF
jgi:hypothetical protein